MNKVKEQKEKKEGVKKSGFLRSVTALFSGAFLSKENIVSSLPYVLYLTILCVFYIANGYYSEKTVRDLYKVGTELKELRSEYITIKSDLNFQSKQSQVAQSTIEMGVLESVTPPSKIVVSEEEFKEIHIKD